MKFLDINQCLGNWRVVNAQHIVEIVQKRKENYGTFYRVSLVNGKKFVLNQSDGERLVQRVMELSGYEHS